MKKAVAIRLQRLFYKNDFTSFEHPDVNQALSLNGCLQPPN